MEEAARKLEAEGLTGRPPRPLSGSSGTEGTAAFLCQICRDTGYQEFEKDGYAFVRECGCGLLRRERLARKLTFAAIPKEFEGQSVGNFRTDLYSEGRNRNLAGMAKRLASEYVRQFAEISGDGKGFYFHSGVKGSGKTRLAASIANDLIAQHKAVVKFATTLQILDQIKKAWGGKAGSRDEAWEASEQKLVNDIISVPVLVIDDIGVEQSKDWVNERFYNIINGRMVEKRVTIFTSNYRMEKLRLDDRIVSRIEKMAFPVEFPGESVRREIARKENGDLLDRLLGK